MSDSLEIIDRLPGELKSRLEADGFFCDVPVLVYEEQNVPSEVAARQSPVTTKNGKRGLSVLVLQMEGEDERPNLRFGPMTLLASFWVIENLELNRDPNGTGKSARKAARRLKDVVRSCDLAGLVVNIRPLKPCIRSVNLGEKLGALLKVCQVDFECLEKPDTSPSQVETPGFTVNPSEGTGTTVTITSPSAGAVIYYTTDDSYPWSGNDSAKEYRDPVAVPAGGCVVRACAYGEGLVIASGVARQFIGS